MSQDKKFSDKQTLLFMTVLSVLAAFILALLASVLKEPKEIAREIDRSKQMLMAAGIYNNQNDHFQLKEKKGTYIPAKYVPKKGLVSDSNIVHPTTEEILEVYRDYVIPFLVDDQGKEHTFDGVAINQKSYIEQNRKKGYGRLPYKLAYKVLAEPKGESPLNVVAYVLPVSGFGLWDYIYGYIAIAGDGKTIIGISWYDHKETPGLGANIAEYSWQKQFPGKTIFQPDSTGAIDYNKSSLGITVVRGTVQTVIGDNPKAQNAVDGMAGATLTGNGVTKAYKDTLEPYRPFFVRLQEQGRNH